jgi:hypothetical protein
VSAAPAVLSGLTVSVSSGTLYINMAGNSVVSTNPALVNVTVPIASGGGNLTLVTLNREPPACRSPAAPPRTAAGCPPQLCPPDARLLCGAYPPLAEASIVLAPGFNLGFLTVQAMDGSVVTAPNVNAKTTVLQNTK